MDYLFVWLHGGSFERTGVHDLGVFYVRCVRIHALERSLRGAVCEQSPEALSGQAVCLIGQSWCTVVVLK